MMKEFLPIRGHSLVFLLWVGIKRGVTYNGTNKKIKG